jgi:hypothetical protein
VNLRRVGRRSIRSALAPPRVPRRLNSLSLSLSLALLFLPPPAPAVRTPSRPAAPTPRRSPRRSPSPGRRAKSRAGARLEFPGGGRWRGCSRRRDQPLGRRGREGTRSHALEAAACPAFKGAPLEFRAPHLRMDVQAVGWQVPNLLAGSHPALLQLRASSNELHSWFHSRKPSMDEVGNPNSVNAR